MAELLYKHKILGNVDRKKLGEQVFSNPKIKKKLEEYIHPKVREEILHIFKQDCNEVFISVPLLFEAGFEDMFDIIIFISCKEEIRLERLMKRNGLTKEEAMKRIKAQQPEEEKVAKADYVVYNNSDLNTLKSEIYRILKNIGLSL